MKMKSVLTVFAVLTLFSASSALAAARPGPVQQEKQRIEQKAAKADKVCQDRRLSQKNRSRQICRRYGICNNNVPCDQAVRQWKDRSLANLMNSPAAKPGPAPQPPPDIKEQNHIPPPLQPGQNNGLPQGQNHLTPPPPNHRPR